VARLPTRAGRPASGGLGEELTGVDGEVGDGQRVPVNSANGLEEREPFRIEVEPSRDVVRVVPVGELDLATTEKLRQEIDRLHEAGFNRLVLDLSRLRFMDSTGLRLVLEVDAGSRADGWTFSLVRGPAAVQRLFEVTNLAQRLDFVDR
jgi:anti-sigma B factor antagonist